MRGHICNLWLNSYAICTDPCITNLPDACAEHSQSNTEDAHKKHYI